MIIANTKTLVFIFKLIAKMNYLIILKLQIILFFRLITVVVLIVSNELLTEILITIDLSWSLRNIDIRYK